MKKTHTISDLKLKRVQFVAQNTKLMLKYEKEGFFYWLLKKKKAKSLLVVDYGTMYSSCWLLQYITHYRQRIDRLRMESDIIEKQLQ